MNKNILKICFISAFGLALLQATPNFKGEKVAEEMPVSVQATRAGGWGHFIIPELPSLVEQGTIGLLNYREFILYSNNVAHLTFTPTANGSYTVQAYSNEFRAVRPEICVDSEYFDPIYRKSDNPANKDPILAFEGRANQTVDIYLRFEVPSSGGLLDPVHYSNETMGVVVRQSVANGLCLGNPISNADLVVDALDILDDKMNEYIHSDTYIEQMIDMNMLTQRIVLIAGQSMGNDGFGVRTRLTYIPNQPNDPEGSNKKITIETTNLDMHGNCVMFWNSPYSATPAWDSINERFISVAEHAVELGSMCSIGFNGNPTNLEIKQFSDTVVCGLNFGLTVAQAISAAQSSFNVWNGCEIMFPNSAAECVTVFGNSSVKPLGNDISNDWFFLPDPPAPFVLK